MLLGPTHCTYAVRVPASGVPYVYRVPWHHRSPVVGLALSIAFQLCMLLAAYNTEVVLVGLRRKVRTLGRWDLARQRS